MMVFRMALLPIAQIYYTFFIFGSISTLDIFPQLFSSILLEAKQWIIWLSSIFCIKTWWITNAVGSYVLPYLYFLWNFKEYTTPQPVSHRRLLRWCARKALQPEDIIKNIDGREHLQISGNVTVFADISYLYCQRTYTRFFHAWQLAQLRYYDTSRATLKWLFRTKRYPPNGYISMLLLTLISVWILLFQILYGYWRLLRHKIPIRFYQGKSFY